MKMTLDERETNLFFNEADKTVQIVSYDKRLNKRLRNLAQLRPQECKPIPLTTLTMKTVQKATHFRQRG